MFKPRLSLFIFLLFVTVVGLGVFTPDIAQAQDTLAEQLEGLVQRVQNLEDRIALSTITPFTLDPGPDGYVREGSGNWTGTITIDTEGTRIFIVNFPTLGCPQKVRLIQTGGSGGTDILSDCGYGDGVGPTGGMVLNFGDFGEAGRHKFLLGEYTIQIESEGEWVLTVLGTLGT